MRISIWICLIHLGFLVLFVPLSTSQPAPILPLHPLSHLHSSSDTPTQSMILSHNHPPADSPAPSISHLHSSSSADSPPTSSSPSPSEALHHPVHQSADSIPSSPSTSPASLESRLHLLHPLPDLHLHLSHPAAADPSPTSSSHLPSESASPPSASSETHLLPSHPPSGARSDPALPSRPPPAPPNTLPPRKLPRYSPSRNLPVEFTLPGRSIVVDSHYNSSKLLGSLDQKQHHAAAVLRPYLHHNLHQTANAPLPYGDTPRHSVFDPASPLYEFSKPRRAVPGCQALFTVSSGRSGTSWMNSVMRDVPGVFSEHEPSSSICGTNAIKLVKGLRSFESTYLARLRTMTYMNNQCLTCWNQLCKFFAVPSANNTLYAQSSHLFFKGYQDLAISQVVGQFNCTTHIVLLRRYLPDVVGSLVRLGFAKTVMLNWYYTLKHRSLALLPYLPPPQRNISLEIWDAIGYIADIERHFELLQELYHDHPNIHFHEISLEHTLLTLEGLIPFLESLGLPPGKLIDIFQPKLEHGLPVNTKNKAADRSELTLLQDHKILSILRIWIQEYTAHGIPLPSSLLKSFYYV